MVTVLFVSTTSSSRRRNNINNSSKVLLVLLVGVASLAPHVHPFSSFRGGPRRRRQHTISSAFLALPIINNKDPSSSSSWLASSALKLYRDFKQSGGPKETDHWKTNQPVPPRQPTTTTTTTATTTTTSHWTQRIAAIGLLSAALLFSAPTTAWAENELSAKYGGGLDTSLVDQTCLVDYCSLQAKSCLQDDPSCRKGLTCTAKCLGDNACITGCMARYGNERLDDLLKCTIEDHDCIKVAILPGGADSYGTEPRAPAPTVPQFNVHSMEGSWFKVVGYNPNYDCYACQRNSFSTLGGNGDVHNNNNKEQQLQLDVEFSMPHLLPDGSPPPPSGVQESVLLSLTDDSSSSDSRNGGGLQSMALNDYRTHEVMVFDNPSVNYNGNTNNPWQKLVLNKGNPTEATYARTAHSEGEMFGLKFWENWYIVGENDKDSPEFKFVYYNGKTRQNTYEGAFVYSRTKELAPESMMKVYQIAEEAGMNPDQFCRIRNGCFADPVIKVEPDSGWGAPSNPFRGILASTRVSELLGVEPVAARDTLRRNTPTATVLQPPSLTTSSSSAEATHSANDRKWWFEVGDYLENPHRHFQAMDSLRLTVDWPDDVKALANSK